MKKDYNGMSSWVTLEEQKNDYIIELLRDLQQSSCTLPPAHLSNSMNFFKNVSRKLKIRSWILVEYFISRLRKSVQIFRKNGAFLHTELENQFHKLWTPGICTSWRHVLTFNAMSSLKRQNISQWVGPKPWGGIGGHVPPKAIILSKAHFSILA